MLLWWWFRGYNAAMIYSMYSCAEDPLYHPVVIKQDQRFISTEEQDEEENEVNSDNRNSDNEDIHEQIKAQSVQLNRLTNMVESL